MKSKSEAGVSATIVALPGGDGLPAQPDWADIFDDPLDQLAAAEHWCTLVSAMRSAGTVDTANGHTMKRLVLFYVEFDRSSRQVASSGKVIKAKRTGVPQMNLEWTGMKQANEACTSLEAELGISPRRRNAAGKAQRQARKATAADAYLAPKRA